jgi:trigger factor
MVEKEQGQEYSIDHDFPDEERFENFQGKLVRFAYQIDEVKIRELPDLNDELAQSVGEYETLDALKAFILESLESQRLSEYHQEYDDELLDKIVADATIKYPPQMVEREIEILKHDLEDRLGAENLDMSIYLKTREMTEEDLVEELRPVAQRRIDRGLVLMEVAEQEKIEVQPKDVEADVSRTIDQFYQLMPEKEARQRLTTDAIQNLVSQMIGDRMTAMTVERLRDIARGVQAEETEQLHAEAAEDKPPDGEASEGDPPEPVEEAVEAQAVEAPAAEEPDVAEAAETEPVKAASESD